MNIEKRIEAVRQAKSPVLLFNNALGDHLLSRPTVLALQSYFGGRLAFAGRRGIVNTFYPDVNFRSVHDLSMPDQYGYDVAEIAAFRDDFDAIINLNWWESDGSRQIFQAFHDVPSLHLCKEHGMIPSFGTETHIVDYMFRVAEALGVKEKVEHFSSMYPADIRWHIAFEEFKKKIKPATKVVAMHTLTGVSKQWPIDKFSQLINRILRSNPDLAVLLVDPIDRGLDESNTSERIIRLENGGIPMTSIFVSLCDAFVGIDSYFLHVADLSRVPSIGIFGPTKPVQWGCRFTRHVHVTSNEITNIPVDEVFHELTHLLDENVIHTPRTNPIAFNSQREFVFRSKRMMAP
jgi:hypothetical protein